MRPITPPQDGESNLMKEDDDDDDDAAALHLATGGPDTTHAPAAAGGSDPMEVTNWLLLFPNLYCIISYCSIALIVIACSLSHNEAGIYRECNFLQMFPRGKLAI